MTARSVPSQRQYFLELLAETLETFVGNNANDGMMVEPRNDDIVGTAGALLDTIFHSTRNHSCSQSLPQEPLHLRLQQFCVAKLV